MSIAAAVSFGSFGDIVTIVQLVAQLCDALNDVTGAPTEIEALSADLNGYMLVLTMAEGILLARDSYFDPRARIAIEGGLKRCKDTLLAIQRHVDAFAARLQPRASRHILGAYAAAVRWRLFGARKEVSALHARLDKQLLFVQMCLGVSHSHGQRALHEVAERNRVAVERILLLGHTRPPHIIAGASILQLCDWRTGLAYEAHAVVPLRMLRAYLKPLTDCADEAIVSIFACYARLRVSSEQRRLPTVVESMRPGLMCGADVQLTHPGGQGASMRILIQCTYFKSGSGESHALIGVPPFPRRDDTLAFLSDVIQWRPDSDDNERRREARRNPLRFSTWERVSYVAFEGDDGPRPTSSKTSAITMVVKSVGGSPGGGVLTEIIRDLRAGNGAPRIVRHLPGVTSTGGQT